MRLFFALPLPGEAKEALRQPLEEARKAGGDGVGDLGKDARRRLGSARLLFIDGAVV